MKKRIISVLLLLALFPAILLLAASSLPHIYSESYYAELADMVDHLHTAQGNRIILVGGSNIAFGIDTHSLEEALTGKGYSYTVCSFGFYAAVGTDAMLSLAAREIREGDIIILAPEPVSEALSTYFGAAAFLKCAEGRPDLLIGLNSDQLSAAAGSLLPCLQEKYSIVRSGILPKAEGVYAHASFDTDCNMTYDRAGNIMTLGYDTTSPIDTASLEIEGDFQKRVNEFCKNARSKGAQVLMSFSPMNASAIEGSSADCAEALFRLYSDTFDCTIISDPNNYILESGWFYDSNFHLNSAGAEIRTRQLALDLLAELGCYQPIEGELPLMPAALTSEAVETADSGDYLFADTAGGDAWLISGLTEQGLAKETLTLPETYQGKPVIGLTEDALRGASMLVELQVPDGISTIPDYLFADCSRLSRLVLAHTSAPCTITEHSLDGIEQAKIFVPTNSYAWYRDGYGCEANSWHAYISRIYTY